MERLTIGIMTGIVVYIILMLIEKRKNRNN